MKKVRPQSQQCPILMLRFWRFLKGDGQRIILNMTCSSLCARPIGADDEFVAVASLRRAPTGEIPAAQFFKGRISKIRCQPSLMFCDDIIAGAVPPDDKGISPFCFAVRALSEALLDEAAMFGDSHIKNAFHNELSLLFCE